METYISDLLHRYDCVIVPGLGGFITNYKPAQIHPVSHTFRPPSKDISFNIQLQNNDGLLINYIADCESIEFDNAQARVERFVKSIKNDLEHKKEAQLEQIGVLTRNLEGKLTFEPNTKTNYLLDAFGLDTVQSPGIIRKKTKGSLAKKVAKRANTLQPKPRSINWKVAAVLVPFIGLSSYISFQQEAVSETYANYAYLNPFKVKPAAVYIPRTNSHNEQTLVLNPIEISTPETPKATPAAIESEIPKIKEPALEAVLEAETVLNFHLVAGCFSSNTNAQKLVSNLQSEGFDASIIGQNATGLYRVAYQSFSNREEAISKMQNLKDSGKSTWLLKQ